MKNIIDMVDTIQSQKQMPGILPVEQIRCVHELFEEQALQTPHACAVSHETQALTYQQLNERANQLAHYLKHLGVGREVRVGICMERSLNLLVGFLGILKAGGGYSRLACPARMAPAIANKGREIVIMPQQETSTGNLARANESELIEMAGQVDVVILGPGISLEKETRKLARALAAAIEKPLILDGDGITALCGDLSVIRSRKAPTVLTPHAGEMSRITGLTVVDIENDKIGILQRTCRDLSAIMVLKGAHSLVGFPDGKVFINLSGNNGMATAGSGDVLTGTIAAMFGLGLPLENAVRKGVFIHGLAGDLAARDLGGDGMIAQDILGYLPKAMRMDRQGLPLDLKQRYMGAQLL